MTEALAHVGLADPAPLDPSSGTSRSQVLQTLRQSPEALGIRELSERVGLHANTVRFHLEHLVEQRLVERSTIPSGGRGRPRSAYVAAAQPGAREDQRSYRLLAQILAGFVADTVDDPAQEARKVGASWGNHLTAEPASRAGGGDPATGSDEAVDNLMRLLDEVGFAPEMDRSADHHGPESPESTGSTGSTGSADGAHRSGPDRIRVHHCPFLEVATEHPEVVCSIHLGLMQGALAKMRAPVVIERLLPFAEPSQCIAEIGGNEIGREQSTGEQTTET